MLGSRRVAVISAIIYGSISLAAGATFLLVTVLTGDYGWVARLGGSTWVTLLSLIILMPTVIPWVKRRAGS